MQVSDTGTFNLAARVKGILLSPKSEWEIIAAEPTSIAGLYRRYAIILAAIPAIAQFLRSVLFGYGFPGFAYRPSILSALIGAATQYALALMALAVIAVMTDFIVTKFDGESNRANAFKLATFGLTASWLAGGFELIPGLGMLSLLGVYSFYLVYTGLPILMAVPRDKALVCTLAIAVGSVVTMAVAGALVSPIVGWTHDERSPSASAEAAVGGILAGVSGTSTRTDLEARLEQVQRNAKQAASQPVGADRLKAFLPAQLGPYVRDSISSTSMGQRGGSSVSATYNWDGRVMKVEIVDMAAMGAFAGIGSALGIQSESETADGFSRVRTMGDRMVTEKWSESSGNGSYSTAFADRFMVTVEGDADSFGTIEAAAGEIDLDRISALAR